MKHLLPFVLLAAACGPSLKPAMVERTNSLVTEYSGKGGGTFAAEAFAPGSMVRPMPWAVGQWVAYKVAHKGETSVMKFAVVGKDARGWWYETDTQSGYDRVITKVLFAKGL